MNTRFPWPAARALAWYVGAVLAGAVIGWALHGERAGSEKDPAHEAVSGVEQRGASEGWPSTGAVGAEASRVQRYLGFGNARLSLEQQRDLCETVLSMPPEEIVAALEIVARMPYEMRTIAADPLLRRWAELDTPAALAYVLDGKAELLSVQPVMETWVQKDRQAALQWVLGLSGPQRDSMLIWYADALGEIDPQALVPMLKLLPRNGSGGAVQRAFKNLARQDPRSAANQALGVPPGFLRKMALEGATMEWGETDPAAVWLWGAALEDKASRREVVASAAYQWARKDPRAAMATVFALPPGLERDEILSNMHNRILREAEPEVALEYLQQMPAEDYARDMAVVVESLAQKDTAAALALVQKLDPEGKTGALIGVVRQWGGREPQPAAEYALKHGNMADQEWSVAVGRVVGDWASNDFARAMRWVEAVPDAGVRGQLLGTLARELSNTDPPGAATLLERVPEEALNGLGMNIASDWLSLDPEAARTWALNLPEGKTKEEAVMVLMNRYTGSYPAEAAAFLQQLAPGNSRDQAVESFVQMTLLKDPEAACEWALTVGDGVIRARTIELAGETWLKQDRATAMQWIRTTKALSPQEREKLLKMAEPGEK